MKPQSKPELGRFYNCHLKKEDELSRLMPAFLLRDGSDRDPHAPQIAGLWSGDKHGFDRPPSIGTRVKVPMNALGAGVVEGYFVEAGFIGLYVQLDDDKRPAWHKKQNPENTPAMVFGAEIGKEI